MSKSVSLNPAVYLFSKMWKYSDGNRKTVSTFWAMFAFASLVALTLEPLILAKIMNIIQKDGINKQNIPTLSLLLLGCVGATIVFWALHGPARVMETNNALKLKNKYRNIFLFGVMHMPMSWHNDRHSGETIDKIDKGSSSIYLFSEDSFQLLYGCANLVVCYAVLLVFNVSSGLIALAFLAISVMITIKIDKTLVKNYSILSKGENVISQNIFDSLSNITTIIILRVEKYVLNNLKKKMEKQEAITFATNRLSETKWFLTSLCCGFMVSLVLIHYFWTISKDNSPILIGGIYLLLSYMRRISTVFYEFTSLYSNLVKWKVRSENAETIARDFSLGASDQDILPEGWGTIEVRNMSFSYPDSVSSQLEGIDLSFRRGEKIALVGESGSGKTTFMRLMRGLFVHNRGEVLVDGKVLPRGFNDFGASVALIPQDPEIFKDTIVYNIDLGGDFEQREIDLAIRMSCFDTVLPKLPNGIESIVNEKGVNLSGGQKQRLALARGILASLHKDIILLDEPTSSLDGPTEKRVYQNMFEVFSDKLIISSLHKLYLLSSFDRIVVFGGGKVVAFGTFSELMNSCQLFQEMWNVHCQNNKNTQSLEL